MLRITILAVGGLKERHWAEAAAEYKKRLLAYSRPEIIEIPAFRLPRNPSSAEIQKCVTEEGRRILERLPPDSCRAALCVEGGQLTSEALAERIRDIAGTHSHIAWIIGGSHGLSEEVKAASALRLSISAMTFPHQLARVMLLEQLYRAFSIMGNGKYHK